MPILAPLAGFAGVPKQIVVTAYQCPMAGREEHSCEWW